MSRKPLGLKRRLTPEDKAAINELHALGWSGPKIAKHIGRPLGTICSFKWSEGLTDMRPKLTEAEKAARREQNALRVAVYRAERKPQRDMEKKRLPPAPKPAWAPWQSRFLKPSDRRAGK